MLKLSAIGIAIALTAGLHASVHAMGPDPGGHTGAGVTPETTKTDRAQVDAARQAASGSEVEQNQAGDSSAKNSAKRRSDSDETTRRAN